MVVLACIGVREDPTMAAIRVRINSSTGSPLRAYPVAFGVVAALLAIYLAVLHPWLMSWGATTEEQQMTLPGDELATGSVTYFTRAIDIDAPPAAVWPWLVQMGEDRAGFYSNTWLENITGSNIHNADTIHPEWQQRAVGDIVPLTRPDLLFGFGAVGRTDIFLVDPPIAIGNNPGRFVLLPVDGQRTRLLVREAIDADPGLHSAGQGPLLTRWLLWDPMHFVMVQRMMRGIKERAEGHPLVHPPTMLAARLGWALAGLGLLGWFASRRHCRGWLLLPLVLPLPALWASADWDAALAAFLAVGITLAGALEYGRGWWATYLLVASGVAFVLLLTPDAYTAFGLVFLLIVALGLAGGVSHRRHARSASLDQTEHWQRAPTGRGA
jgi:hypothetical protein